MSRKPTKNIDYTSRDYVAFKEMLLKSLQENMPEYTDTSETDAGIVILEALANGLDIMSLYADIIANDVILPTTQSRKIAVLIAGCLGYFPYNQTASIYPQVFVLTAPQEKDIIIPKGTQVKTPESKDLATLYFETMEDLLIPAGKMGDEQDEEGNYLYTVPVHSGSTILQDVIGTSSGSPLQSFRLNYKDVLVDSIELYINEGEGDILWRRVDSFIEAKYDSRVYTASVDDFDVCTIKFGNGLRGKIPVSFPNGITANYRIGGGEASNVNSNVITELTSGLSFVDSTFNLEVVVRGHDKESLESIKQNAPASFKSRDRLVTLEDYEDLLRMTFYDLLEVQAVQDADSKKLCHLYYMMREEYEMTETLQEEIAIYIGSRSMIGTTYDLNPFTPQEVNIEAKLYVDPDYDKDSIENEVRMYLEQVTFKYGELAFDDTIVKSDIESEIKKTFEGILSFRISDPDVDIISPQAPENILVLGELNIESIYL